MKILESLKKIGSEVLQKLLGNQFKSLVTWPEGTEYLSNGPFFKETEDDRK